MKGKVKNNRKYLYLLLIGLLFTCNIRAINYYISGNGNDKQKGTDVNEAWRSIDRLNKQDLQPGDSVFFQSGSMFIGTVRFNESGNPQQPIVISSYGKGPKPVITGATMINKFKQEDRNVFSATINYTVKNLYRDHTILSIARYPNKGFLFMDGGGEKHLVEENLPFERKILKNATVRMRTVNWQYETREIIDVENNKLYFDSILFNHSKDTFTCKNGWGYYLENKLDFLDNDGEWFFNPNTNKIYLYSSEDLPAGFTLTAAFLENGITMAQQVSNIEIRGLQFTKFNQHGVLLTGNNKNIAILDCEFQNIYKTAIICGLHCNAIKMERNEITDIYGQGISLLESGNCLIKNNHLKRIGIVPGYGIDGVNGGAGIIITNREHVHKSERIESNNNYIAYNIIDSTGYGSIRLDGKNSICEFNVVSNALLTLNDGGMIYCWGIDTAFTHHNIIRNNIVQYNIGNTKGTPKDHGINIGIYIDNNTHHNRIENNIIRGVGSGIHVNDGAFNHSITGNICFGNKTGISFAEWNYERLPGLCENNICTGNIMFNTENLHHTLSLLHTYAPEFDPAYIDSNIYVSPNEEYHIKKATVEDGCKHTREYTLASWKKQSNDDTESVFIDLDADTKYLFLLNKNSLPKEFLLKKGYEYSTLDGKKVLDRVELSPYSALILLYKLM